MTVATPTIEAFDGGNFDDYLDRVECFFCANDIGGVPSSASAAQRTAADKKMTATLITLIGKDTYTILRIYVILITRRPANTESW